MKEELQTNNKHITNFLSSNANFIPNNPHENFKENNIKKLLCKNYKNPSEILNEKKNCDFINPEKTHKQNDYDSNSTDNFHDIQNNINCFNSTIGNYSNNNTININNLYCFGSKANLITNISHNKFSYAHALPITYFIVSISSLFILILIHFYQENFFNFNIHDFKIKNVKKITSPYSLFPNFFKIKKIQPIIFSIAVSIISLSGLLNVWCYCSMLLQRFSVPEFRNNKILIHFMFILGIISNLIILFFGVSPSFLNLESIKIKEIKISITTITYLIFIFLNILFAVIGFKNLEFLKKQIDCNDEIFSKKLNNKRVILYLCLFLLLIYILAICIKQKENSQNYYLYESKFLKNKKFENFIFDFILFFYPYLLFILNAFLNLGFYSDIIYLQKILTTIIDKEYFLMNEDNSYLLA